MKTEVWKPVIGFNGYEVSNFGRVRSYRSYLGKKITAPHYLSPCPMGDSRHLSVSIYKDDGKRVSKSICSILLEAFIGPKQKNMGYLYKDGDKKNIKLTNLSYIEFKKQSKVIQLVQEEKPIKIKGLNKKDGLVYFRMYYTEPEYKEYPVRYDLCVKAYSKDLAKNVANKVLGENFILVKLEFEKNPSNVVNF